MKTIKKSWATEATNRMVLGEQWECTACHAVVEFESDDEYVSHNWDADGEGRYVIADCPHCRKRDYTARNRHQEFRPYSGEE